MEEGITEGFERFFVRMWSRMGEPLRPSEWLKAFYARWMDLALGENDRRMLILGSTPELRDMALARGIVPVCCDLSEPIWREMKSLMNEGGEEEFLLCDWLKVPTDRGFRFIAGDAPTVFLRPEQIEPFIGRMAAVLSEGGIMAIRACVRTRSHDLSEFGDALERYRRGEGGDSLHLWTAFLINVLMSEHYPSMGKRELMNKVLRPYMTDEEFAGIEKHYLHDQKFYSPEKDHFDQLLSRHFRIVDAQKQEGPLYWDSVYVYALQKGREDDGGTGDRVRRTP